MKIKIHQKLYELACALDKPLYLVGGAVRNALLSEPDSPDLDLAAAIPVNKISEAAKALGFRVDGYFRRTGTALLFYGEERFEYTTFRREGYLEGGFHIPAYTEETDSIEEDAKRRDFRCNALYYDIKAQKIVDPTGGGLSDIQSRRLYPADQPQRMFSCDGLRLMRLARFSAELGFSVDEETLSAAAEFADNILDISVERVYEELKKILTADTRYSFSDKNGHYNGLKILDRIGVLDRILPELTMGRGMAQRADYHKYDVLEHSLKTVLYAPQEIRLAALLHDVAKPICMKKLGEFTGHAQHGERIAINILKRLKVDAKTIKLTAFLVGAHMKDLNGDMGENKVRKFIADNVEYIPQLLALKQADFSAGKDDSSPSPTVQKWQGLYERMLQDGTPFTVTDLNVSSERLMEIGFYGAHIGAERIRLKEACIIDPSLNNLAALTELAQRDMEKLKKSE